ncbi:MAG: phosphate ABC transporter permease family protein, partial [Gammaproteobacteria bacterium]|nr:phosphate ABC transporter permease family protein [Gammaproteobacteria bacterium]
METSGLILSLLVLSSMAYYFGSKRSLAVAGGQVRKLHSLPGYYGMYVALWCGLPALLIVLLWSSFEPSIITNIVVTALPEQYHQVSPDKLTLIVNDIK